MGVYMLYRLLFYYINLHIFVYKIINRNKEKIFSMFYCCMQLLCKVSMVSILATNRSSGSCGYPNGALLHP